MIIKHDTSMLDDGTYRLKMWVHEYDDSFDPYIFVYQRPPTMPENDDRDWMVDIASLADMKEYPKEAPNPDQPDIPFYRDYYLDLEFKDINKMKIAVKRLMNSINDLVKNISDVNDTKYEVTYEEEI